MDEHGRAPGGVDRGRTGAGSLRRSRTERVLAGVCGGFAEYLRVEANLVRLVVVLLTVFGGGGALAYLASWLLIPDDGEDTSVLQRYLGRQR